MTKKKATRWQIDGLTLLGVAFVVLKLLHVIGWSWWWVTMPFWGVAAMMLAVLIVGVIVVGVITVLE